MKVKIEPLNIRNNKTNEVTSSKIFRDRKAFDKDGNPNFHEDGIFSKKIFGQYGHCNCKENPRTKPGYCEKCGTRVLSYKKTPDFYILFKGINIPKMFIDYKSYPKLKKELDKLFNYEAFIYDGKFVELDIQNINLEDFEDDKKLLIGKDAILSLGVAEDWYNNQVTDKLFIPHPAFRPITVSEDKHFLGSLNTSLVTILKKKEQLIKMFGTLSVKDKFTKLMICNEIVSNVRNVYNEIFQRLGKRKKAIINTEVRGQSLTGAIRGVVTNNFKLDEDSVILGKYFIPTLYPELMKKHCKKELVGIEKDGSNKQIWETDLSQLDINSLNAELRDGNYYVLVNRPPTIGEKSIMAMKPQFSLKDEEKYVIQIPPIVQDGFAGDYDGDTYLVIALYTNEANKEAEKLLPSKNYIGGADDKIRNGIIEEFEYVMQKTYENNNTEEIEKIHNLIVGE